MKHNESKNRTLKKNQINKSDDIDYNKTKKLNQPKQLS